MTLRTRSACSVLLAITLCCGGCSGDEPAPTRASTPSGTTTAPAPGPRSGTPTPAGEFGVFSAANPWTKDVSASPVSERSAAITQALTDLGGWGNENKFQVDFAIPVFFADKATKRVEVTGVEEYCFGGPACDPVPAQMPLPDGAYIEGSTDLNCDASGNTDAQGDCHLLVVERDERKLYEIYQATAKGDGLAATAFFVWDLAKTYPDNLRGDQCTSADAAGFPIAGLLPTADEVAAGAINHALRFILPNNRMKESVYVHPASHAGGPEATNPDAPPYGVRMRLRADFDESAFSDGEKVVLKALKTHGMLLSDGGEIALTFADDKTSTAKWADLGVEPGSFSDIGVDQFDVVELGPEIPLTYDCVRNPQ